MLGPDQDALVLALVHQSIVTDPTLLHTVRQYKRVTLLPHPVRNVISVRFVNSYTRRQAPYNTLASALRCTAKFEPLSEDLLPPRKRQRRLRHAAAVALV